MEVESVVWGKWNSLKHSFLMWQCSADKMLTQERLEEESQRFALVPLGPPWLAYKRNCKEMLTAVEGVVRLVVGPPYKAGESIVVWCRPQLNSKLLLNHGFVDQDNPCECLLVEASLNTKDPQYQGKRMVAKNGKLYTQVFQVNAGKEREAVLNMLPYLRLGYMSDQSEIQSVILLLVLHIL